MATTLTFAANLIQISFHDEVTREDLSELITRISEVERLRERVPHRLVLISESVGTVLSYEAIEEFADLRSTLCYKNSFKTALVASRPLQVGYARIFQSLNRNPQIEVQIFSTEGAAREWLDEQRPLGGTFPWNSAVMSSPDFPAY